MAEFKVGPKGDVTLEKVKSLIQIFKSQQVIGAEEVSKVLDGVLALFKTEKNVIEVNIGQNQTACVFGNLAGQYYDLINMFEDNGLPSESNFSIFLGNYVDRGYFSFETMTLLFALKLLYPKQVVLVRGNHECEAINKVYGFFHEMEAKYPKNPELYNKFNEVFNLMPLACLVNDGAKRVFLVHGGLSQHGNQTLDDISLLNRFKDCPKEPCLMQDLLWADPHDENGFATSPRGAGILFGPDNTKQFLEKNGLYYLIRSHQLVNEGFEKVHNDKCVTIWSAPNYCNQCGNRGGFLKLTGGDMSPVYKGYDAVTGPKPTWEMDESCKPAIPNPSQYNVNKK